LIRRGLYANENHLRPHKQAQNQKERKTSSLTCRKIKAENLMKEEENFKGDAALGR